MDFIEFFNLWNDNANGELKKHRILIPLETNDLLQKRFKRSKITREIAITAIEEVRWFINNDDFWATRRKKQGIPWFFQERKDGTPNWAWFYEHRLDRLEREEEKEELQNNVFKFEKAGELP